MKEWLSCRYLCDILDSLDYKAFEVEVVLEAESNNKAKVSVLNFLLWSFYLLNQRVYKPIPVSVER